MSKRRLIGMVLSATFLAGCGAGGESGLVPVTGTVTLDGKPLTNANLAFVPTGQTKGRASNGRTDDKGVYTLTSPKGKKGALPGEYKVTVSKFVDPKTGADAAMDPKNPPIQQNVKELMPIGYQNASTTPITKTVPAAGGAVDIDIKLKK